MLALNRSAIVVRPRSPFLDWLHAVDPTGASLTLMHLTREPTICLVSECGDPNEEQACLQAVFPTIFEDQLDGWWRDRTMWPTPRSWGTFTCWFACQVHSMRLDLTDEPLIEGEVEAPAGACRSSCWTLRG